MGERTAVQAVRRMIQFSCKYNKGLNVYIHACMEVCSTYVRSKLTLCTLASRETYNKVVQQVHVKHRNTYKHIKSGINMVVGTKKSIKESVQDVRDFLRATPPDALLGYLVGNRTVLDPCLLYAHPTIRKAVHDCTVRIEGFTPKQLRTMHQNACTLMEGDKDWEWWQYTVGHSRLAA